MLASSEWAGAFTGYYPPGFPLAIRSAHAIGLDWEIAGRLAALVCGAAAIPLTARLATTAVNASVAVGAALLVAVHPHLVRASAEVLPETTYGLLVLVWALVVMSRPATALRAAAAGAIAAIAALVRVEGIALVALTALAAAASGTRSARLGRAAAAVGVAALLLVPVVVTVHGHTGVWALSGKEGPLLERKYGVGGSGLAGFLVGHPVAFLRTYPRLLAHQLEYTVAAIHPLIAVPLVVGLAMPALGAADARARRLVLATVAVFTLGIAVINPGRRYALPLVPLVLPWAALGARRLATLLGPRIALVVGTIAIAGLAVQGIRVPRGGPEQCYRSLCAWIGGRFPGTPPAILALDGRIAYLCGARFVLEPPDASVSTLAAWGRARGAGLWIATRERAASVPPSDGLERLTDRCNGAVVVFALREQ
jgi:hypothetical protein